ncbi:MAG: alanine dehydrogenase [Bryobacterales bacterium]|nr:alanine dehydrogenase [Bryobacterales bacterium]
MIIGVPKEIKDHETRVALVPGSVRFLRETGHEVLVQAGAGQGSSFSDEEFRTAGAEIVPTAAELWQRANLITKVKEPQPSEYSFLREDLILFAYLHLAPLPDLTQALLASGCAAIAYETMRESDGTFPLLAPMSEVAGRLSVQIGAYYLEAPNGGRGVLLGGIPGVKPGRVVILGGGVVGTNAAKMALGLGADVTIIDKNINRLRELEDIFGPHVRTIASHPWAVAEETAAADLVIGAVLIPGASAPRVVRREVVSQMKKGSVIVDVAIDQGGCIETARATTHTDPVYFVDDVLHYCVSNMPAAVPNTSTVGLTNAQFPYLMELANKGFVKAVMESEALATGVNTYAGICTHDGVAESLALPFKPLGEVLRY